MNRFNRDQGIIDDTLATTNFDFIQISSFILATFGLSVIVNYFIVVPLAILIGFLLWFRTYYIKIARQLKRLEADERSPLLDLLNAITAGIAIIRSSNKTDEYKRKYNEKMNKYTRVNFPFITAKRWFALRLDLAIVLFIAFIIYGSVFVQNFLENFPITPASIGLLLTYCFQLSTQFQFCVRQSCDAECSMISVERICKYTDKNEYPSESNNKTSVNIKNWPSKGEIKLNNVTFRYNNRSEKVFKNLTLTFEAGKHVGIIGFNGAGKSSFFNLILRLYEISEGEIFIDNVQIHQISLSDVRKNITIIPQDPVIFDTTIRENLDPLNMYDDDQIKTALEAVNLTYSNEKLDDPQEVRHLSKGHKQLLCFARGLLKDTMIYLIDEATSNLSREAEEIIRDVIEKKLKGKTVLIIAHRIETIKNCHKILGVKGNNQFEYDTPENLERNDESMYSKFSKGNLTNNY
uniref:ATP-binding cassette transporter subfamily C member 4 X6 n=1 Tax=Brachionus plicatilis TaxID=10195 RepID=A0A7H9SLK2_BRAPC|nr:ATP-binding cassette transporter subfamily C member 4 X6 [Brachionus plicatilis]